MLVTRMLASSTRDRIAARSAWSLPSSRTSDFDPFSSPHQSRPAGLFSRPSRRRGCSMRSTTAPETPSCAVAHGPAQSTVQSITFVRRAGAGAPSSDPPAPNGEPRRGGRTAANSSRATRVSARTSSTRAVPSGPARAWKRSRSSWSRKRATPQPSAHGMSSGLIRPRTARARSSSSTSVVVAIRGSPASAAQASR